MKGFGRAFIDSQIYDGVFDEGTLKGIGVNYSTKEKTYIFGKFDGNSCNNVISSGEGFPKNLLGLIFLYNN